MKQPITKSTKKPKVLFIGPYPPPFSGPDMAMRTLLESSLSERFSIFFLNTNIRQSNSQRGKVDFAAIMAFFSFIFSLVYLAVVRKPKLVYYFVTATKIGWLGRDIWCIFISKLLVGKIVIHMRAGHFKRSLESCNTLEEAVIRFACALVSMGIVQSKTLRDQFEGLIKDHKIVEIYNAVDTEKYSNELPYAYDPNIILFLGHLSFAKGYCDILRAIPKIAEKYPAVRFYFAGTKLANERNIYYNQLTGQRIVFEDPDECYDKYIRNVYEENYKYFGVVDEAEKIGLFRKCNLLVLPSYSEGLSMAILEAFSMAKPVVCTAVGALGEIVQNGVNGFVVPPGDIERLVRRVLTLLSDSELRNRIALHNKLYARQTFDTKIIANKLADCFEKLLGEFDRQSAH